MTWTRERIIQELGHNNTLVERAILAIYRQQTTNERVSKKTLYRNNMGFSAPDAHLGSYLAQYLNQGHKLSGPWLVKGRKLAIKYSSQLLKIHQLQL